MISLLSVANAVSASGRANMRKGIQKDTKASNLKKKKRERESYRYLESLYAAGEGPFEFLSSREERDSAFPPHQECRRKVMIPTGDADGQKQVAFGLNQLMKESSRARIPNQVLGGWF